MATNGIEMAVDHSQAFGPLDKMAVKKRALEVRADGAEPADAAEDFVLAPLVDKIAYGIARGLVVAVKELEQHIANETRKVGDAVDRRLDTLQISLQDLTRFVGEQRSTNIAVQGQLEELTGGLRATDARLTTAAASLQEADARQSSELDGLRTETKAASSSASERIDAAVTAQRECDARRAAEVAALSQAISERIDSVCRELGVQQEDLSAVKATLGAFSTRVDGLVERLDRQADAVRSMYVAYSQRETELEQLVDGLARLRAYPTPLPTNGL
jgi:chromosome segregation ATPase